MKMIEHIKKTEKTRLYQNLADSNRNFNFKFMEISKNVIPIYRYFCFTWYDYIV
jgi:hypothetical protein